MSSYLLVWIAVSIISPRDVVLLVFVSLLINISTIVEVSALAAVLVSFVLMLVIKWTSTRTPLKSLIASILIWLRHTEMGAPTVKLLSLRKLSL